MTTFKQAVKFYCKSHSVTRAHILEQGIGNCRPTRRGGLTIGQTGKMPGASRFVGPRA